ncbi:hypothetical protein [Garciella nitratireducens]|uniref:Transporter n=1 Tax=Garciella nitratireducens DSM 15102 TaxID=1121911 RepID=A0A1T4NBW8_9FIRM|nr:hypothetical protein [Garciella nitratireducens]RBP37246.1 hypothetical protein DFR81_1256 [Garciella nitratireducens]SJZ76328.1 hypothetical protein SAMN02745973_01614 [Garciella nitratireducens DSM 15102]
MSEITAIHWVYLIMILVILITMILRKDTIIPCIVGIFLIGWVGTGSFISGIGGIFDSFVVAGVELLDIIFVISIIVAMSKMLEDIGANIIMVAPAAKIIKSPNIAFWVSGIIMLLISWFFWPSPATPLVGAVLLPIALKAGLPAIGFAVAINLFGHGIALSSDYIIQGAPAITAAAAGIEVTDVMQKGIPLVITMSVVSIGAAFILLKKDMASGKISVSEHNSSWEEQSQIKEIGRVAKCAAVSVPIVFLLDIIGMFVFELTGGKATALIGGTATSVMIIFTMLEYKKKSLDKIVEYIREGFVFGITIFGPIIPIAAFFYMGEISPIQSVFGENILPVHSQGILSDMGLFLARSVPLNKPIAIITETIVGVITGLDGSGFSGMALAGSVARVFGTAIQGSVEVLAALGQIAAIWVGGGTIIPWSIIPVAAICNIDVMDLARRNFKPVMIGLITTTIVAMFFI